MKRCKLLWIGAILLFVANPAFGETGRFSIGATAGVAWSLVDEAVGGFPNTEFKSSSVYGVSAMYRFPDEFKILPILPSGLALELAAERLEMSLEESGEELGTLEMTPIVLLIKWQGMPSKGSGLTGHAAIGGGINLTNFKKGSVIADLEQDNNVQYTIETDDSFILQAGVGLDYFLGKHFSIGLDGRILVGNVGTSWESSGPSWNTNFEQIDTFNVTNLQALLSLRYWF